MANTLAYGFVGHEHLADERVTDSNRRIVMDAIAASVAEHNRQVDAALAELVERTTEYSVRYKLPGGGTLQPLDEWGNPKPVREEGYYDVAFPIQGGGTAWGDNRVSRALMTVGEANRQTLNALQRDANWMRRHILAALFDNATWTYADEEHGNLTIQPLANGDSVPYLKKSGSSATDTHQYAQANAIDASNNPFPTWYDELAEHPENGNGPFVAYIPSNIKTAVMGLSTFEEVLDPDISYSTASNQLAATVDRGMGDQVLGKVDRVWVVEWKFLPDNYGLVVARGAQTPVLRMREYPVSTLQGLFTENHSPDGNLNEYRFIRYAGFGAYNRVGALAFRIGNGSYATPTGYDAPLAV